MNFISRLINPLQHCEKVVLHLLKSLNVKVTTTTIKKDLLGHPDYPSLLSISDVLKNYGLDNVALKMGSDSFHKLDIPFVVHTSNQETRHHIFRIVSSFNR